MIGKGFVSNLNLKRNDLIYILAILVFTLAIALAKINYYNIIGFNSDVPIYMSNALYYAGINPNEVFSHWWIYSSPTVSFFTSLLFRLGFVNLTAICAVTSVFELFGGVGLYIFLKNRFDSNLSLLGVAFYESTSLFILNASSGMLDTPAVAVSVWILVFAMIAIDKNPKYFIPTSLLFVFGFFTRATVGFVLPVIFLYYFYRHDVVKLLDDLISDRDSFKGKVLNYVKCDEFKYILGSLLLCILSFGIIIIIHYYLFDLPFDLFDRVASSSGGFQERKGIDIGYMPDVYFYIKCIFRYIAYPKIRILGVKLSHILFFIMAFGLLVKLIDIIRKFNNHRKSRIKDYFRTPYFEFMLTAFIAMLLIIAIKGFKYNHFITNISLMFIFIIFGSFVRKLDLKSNRYPFFMLNFSFMVMYLVFISFLSVKVHRYFLPVFVPVAYFFVLAVESILNPVKEYSSKLNVLNGDAVRSFLKYLPLIIALVLLCFAFISMDYFDENAENIKYSKIYEDTMNTSGYLMDLDGDYMDKKIVVDHRNRFYNWFLQRNTWVVDNLYEPVSKFDQSGGDYLFLNESVEFENYTEIYSHGDSYLYVRN